MNDKITKRINPAMGSGRKRPADWSPSPLRDAGTTRGKSSIPFAAKEKPQKETKKPKKLKWKKDTLGEQVHKSSFENNATAEGIRMTQALSTFSRMEQSRFEAFRRATFSGDAISKYVAQCLIEHHPESSGREPVLSELCAPGQAEEITTVVSTLAKAYAQRLVTTARKLAPTNGSIEPQHIMKAYEERRAQGLDPGFFLQPSQSGTTIVLKDESYERRRLAALQAQEDYDKEHAAEEDVDAMETSPTKSDNANTITTP